MVVLELPRPLTTRQLTTFDASRRHKTIGVPRHSRVTVGEVEGSGFIAKLWITFPGWFWQHWAPTHPISQSILKTLILRIFFDGSEQPQIEAPVADFFGIGLGEVVSFTSHYLGMSSGGFYCSLPMPFRQGFRIEFENLDETIDTEVFANVLYQITGDEAALPYLHAQFRTGENSGAEPLPIAEAFGAGRYVGCSLSCQGHDLNYLAFLEAPENVFIDQDWDRPRIVGTGMEDYFLGGWYFREGTFAGPHHGTPVKDTLRSSVAMYRIHDQDAIFFEERLRFVFVNPWSPERLRPFRYSSVAFLYLDQPVATIPVPGRDALLCWYRTRDCDHQSIP